MFGFGKKEKKVKDKKPKKKKNNRPSQEELLKQYEAGKFLQVDNKKDNKEYFKSLRKGK